MSRQRDRRFAAQCAEIDAARLIHWTIDNQILWRELRGSEDWLHTLDVLRHFESITQTFAEIKL